MFEKLCKFHTVEINIVWNFIITQWVVTLKSYFAYVSSTSTTLKWCYTWLYEIILFMITWLIMRNGKMDNVDVFDITLIDVRCWNDDNFMIDSFYHIGK